DLILVELPGIENRERAQKMLSATAELAFWKVYRIDDPAPIQALIDANQRLAQTENVEMTQEMVLDTVYKRDSLGNETAEIERFDTAYADNSFNQGPLLSLLQLNSTGMYGRAVMGVAERNKIRQINNYLSRPGIKALFPSDMLFLWSQDP